MGGCCKTLAAGFDDEGGHARVLWHGDGGADVLVEPDGEGGTDGFVGDAGASASHDRHPPLIGILKERGILRGHQGGLHAEGKEDVGRELDAGGSGEAGWVDANDGDGDEVELDGLADDGGRAAEEAGPETVADDGNGAGAGCVVVGWLDGAAESGLNAELLVEVSGDEFAGDGAGVTVDGSGESG